MNTQLRQKPITDKCADHPYYQVADEPEAATSHDLTGQPTSDYTNQQYDDENSHSIGS